jgi:cytochrome c biogenesis protein CcmG/thiol:disulfide interchange protein DsbE
VRESEAVTDRVRRAVRLLGQHKLGTAIAVLLVAAAVAGVAGGSLNGSPPGSAGAAALPSPAVAPAFTLPALAAPGQPGRDGASKGGASKGAGSAVRLQVSLSQYQGRPLIVNFWASWCVPCQQETPLLASFYRAHGGRVAIVGVDSNDPAAEAIAFVRAKGVGYPVGVDPKLITASAYGVDAFPQTFFLDSRHRIVDHVFGAVTQASLDKGVALMTGNASG